MESNSPPNLQILETELLNQASGHSVRWCRRGTTAGAWAFKAAALAHSVIERPEVIIPATACSTIPAAALIAGCNLKFADVSLLNALPTVETIKAVVTENTVAVLFIHMFGNTADLDEIAGYLSKRNIWLVEDAAQAFYGHTPLGKPLGSFGKMTIHGFTDNKILESGGGALMVRDPVCESYVEEATRLLPRPSAMSRDLYGRYDRSFQAIYNGMVERQRIAHSDENVPFEAHQSVAFEAIIRSYTDWFMQGEPPTMRLGYERRTLEASIEHRLEMADFYRKLLPPELGVSISQVEPSGNCWRYSLLLNDSISQEEMIGSLRRKGFQATDLYWPLDTLLGESLECPNAMRIGRRIINLPVDKGVSRETVEQMVKIVSSVL